MSIRIRLKFVELQDPQLKTLGIEVPIIRIICPVKFKLSEGLTDFQPAILDTGAPISLLPQKIWRQCEVNIFGESSLRGVVPKKECQLTVNVGELRCFLLDEDGRVLETAFFAYLPETDLVPIILGFAGFLQKSKIFIYCEGKDAFLEIRKTERKI